MPILLLLVFAIISFGFLFAQNLALGNAARQAARYGVIEDRTCSDLINQAISAAGPLVTLTASDVVVKRGTDASQTTICSADTDEPCDGSGTQDNIYVTLNYRANVLIPVVPGMGSTMNLDGEGVFRCEWH
jgi:Flp pilus assembly protein TadG